MSLVFIDLVYQFSLSLLNASDFLIFLMLVFIGPFSRIGVQVKTITCLKQKLFVYTIVKKWAFFFFKLLGSVSLLFTFQKTIKGIAYQK